MVHRMKRLLLHHLLKFCTDQCNLVLDIFDSDLSQPAVYSSTSASGTSLDMDSQGTNCHENDLHLLQIQAIPFQLKLTPSTPATQFLFMRQINTTFFEHPHLAALKMYTKVLASSDKQLWDKAMEEEVRSIEDLQVWTPIPRQDMSKGTKLLPWKWMYTYKDGN